MAAEESLIHLLYLFDSLWFNNQILNKNSVPPFFPKVEDENNQPKLARILTCDDQNDQDKSILITTSQESLSSGDSDNLLSPNSVLMRSPVLSKLETILSGKESSEAPEEKQEEKKVSNSNEKSSTTRRMMGRRKRTGKGKLSSRSLSELEFEEVKGFMDLGFVFSEGDKNSSLVKIIPGLQRFGEGEGEKENSTHDNNAENRLIKRPYLSQAWENMEYKRKEAVKWKINAAVLDNEMDMKHQLRFWAQSVASAVK
ncbi:uncharacterized protein LOC141713907 [Apium graveolens]|uniref:uncharacterized protein LOC141713907 n=1 Tax=Apium graveolens TaxID=4045 RepID=UPI003D791279